MATQLYVRRSDLSPAQLYVSVGTSVAEGTEAAAAVVERSMTIQLGPVTVTSGVESIERLAILLWGPAGCGKTTFSATAPGKKLWLSFGDNEHVSIAHRKDVMVANLSGLDAQDVFKYAQSDNPFGLDQLLAKHTEIETVVCDSLTAVTFKALQKAVQDKVGAGRGFTPTMEAPGISAYGGRNAIVLETVTGLLRVTAKHKVHIIFTAHEDDATLTSEGIVDYITVMLGGKIVGNMTWRLSDIWHMSQSELGEKKRRLSVRPYAKRRPMKTRMFDEGNASFDLRYDAKKPDKGQMTIANWWEEWVKKGERLPVPK